MSELKTYKMVDEEYCTDCVCVIPSEVYLKDEADAVFAEKDKELRHQKYKRCLAMAERCSERFYHYVALSSFSPNKGAIPFYDKMLHNAYRWKYKWLDIAERFKEVK